MCARLTVRELSDPIRVCNRYVTGSLDESGIGSLFAARAGQDVLDLVSQLDTYKAGRVHPTGLSVALDLRRGQRQAFLRDVDLPARVRAGRTVRAKVRLRTFRGPRITRSYRLRIPPLLGRGKRSLKFAGADIDGGQEDLLGGLADVLTVDLEEETPGAGSLGPPDRRRAGRAYARGAALRRRHDDGGRRGHTGLPRQGRGASPAARRRPCGSRASRTRTGKRSPWAAGSRHRSGARGGQDPGEVSVLGRHQLEQPRHRGRLGLHAVGVVGRVAEERVGQLELAGQHGLGPGGLRHRRDPARREPADLGARVEARPSTWP